jgi:hypothetical protein
MTDSAPGSQWFPRGKDCETVPSASTLAVVTWEDTTNVATWQDADDIKEFATDGGWVCQNVGWVVYEDEDCIVLAARRADDKQQHVGLAERIPKRSVIDRVDVQGRPGGFEVDGRWFPYAVGSDIQDAP